MPQSTASVVPEAVQVPVQTQEQSEAAVLQSGLTGPQDQTQKLRSATHTAFSVVAGAAPDARLETAPLRSDHVGTAKSPLSEQGDGKIVMETVSAGEQQAGSNQKEAPDRGMNSNFPSQMFHQQVKTEGSPAVGTSPVAAQNDTTRAAGVPEQVVQQVRVRFVNHEAKPGTEQIVLRLTPEHFGELKVNLNLEGQKLKVEIVAENRMVRDSLMQHTDALKESLARQNIKMESFDVTTGGNSSAEGGRSQADWRELAQRRQQNAWMPEGGYRLAQQAVPTLATYQRKSEHTMVDLHY